ncbi:MAG: histidine phosphatase family protein [Pseudomonadota bacterium]
MRQVIVIRHAIAQDPEAAAAAGLADAERVLTTAGRHEMSAVARGLAVLVPELELIFSSPLRRARQTADIVAAAFTGLSVEETEALSPGAPPASLYRQLAAGPRCVAIVGHEPMLGKWVSRSLTFGQFSFIRFEKGGACLLAFPAVPEHAQAELCWFCPPAVLRRLAKGV